MRRVRAATRSWASRPSTSSSPSFLRGPHFRLESWRLSLIILYSSTACLFIGLFFWAQRDRVTATFLGLAAYSILIVPAMVAWMFDPLGVLWLFQLVVLLALIDALRAARHQRRILRQALTSKE